MMIRQHRPLVQIILIGMFLFFPGLSFAYELIVDYTAGGVKTSGVGGTGLWEINKDRTTDPPLGFPATLGSLRASYIRQGSFTGASSTRLQLYNHAMSVDYDCYSQTLTGDEWGANSSDEFATATEGTVAVFSGSECTLDPGISYGVADDNSFTATGQLVFRDGANFPNAWGAAYEGVYAPTRGATQLYFSGSPGNYYLSEQTRDLLKSVGAAMVGNPTATVYRVSFDMGNTDNAYPPLHSKGCTFCDENGNPVDHPTTLGDPIMYNELDGYILPHGTEQWINIETFVNDPCTGSGGLQVAAGKYYISLFGKWESSSPPDHYEWLPYYMVYEVDGNCDTTTPPPPVACGTLASGLDTCLLQKGDILFALLPNPNPARIPAGTYWFHTATYLGNDRIAEAIGAELEDDDEVRTIDIHSIDNSEWANPSLLDWAVIRPNVNSTIREAAALYTGDKADQGDLRINPLDTRPDILYNSFLGAFIRDKHLEDKFYCSQLPWKAYEKQGLDLETNSEDIGLVSLPNVILDNVFFTNFVSPDDLYASIVPQLLTNTPKSSLVAQKVTGLGGAIKRLLFRVFSPVNMLLVDSLGRRTGLDATIGNVLNEIPSTTYSGTQSDPETITATGVEGDLSLHIIGTDSGNYTLEAIHYDLNNTQNQVITRATSPGKEDNYRVSQGSEQLVALIYNFTGFFQPVDNLPRLNTVKAGSAIPVKFSLNGNQGLDIFAAGSPSSQQTTCDTSAPVDGIEETVTAGGSSLRYDTSTDQYVYVWKTDTAWTRTCRQLIVRLNDGMDHRANFKFK